MSLSSGALKPFPALDEALSGSCYCLFRDSRRQLWATSMSGACMLDETNQAFRMVKSFNSLTIDIKEDKKGNIWFATQGNGLWCYRRNKTWKQYLNDANDTTSICSNQVNCVQEDSKGRLLVATNMGLCEYQPSSDSFRRIAIDAPSQDLHPSSSIRMRCGSLLTRDSSSGFPENLRCSSTVMTDSPATSSCRMPAFGF